MGKKWGYARVSTLDQNYEIQVEQLAAAGVPKTRIFAEKISGKSRDGRVELERLLERLEPGDTLVVTKIDRFGRSVVDVLQMSDELKARGVFFQSLDLGIDTSTPMGKFALTIMAGFAELERSRIRERQRDGIDAILNGDPAVRREKYPGRAPVYTAHVDAVWNLHRSGVPKRQIAFMLGVSRTTVYRAYNAAVAKYSG